MNTRNYYTRQKASLNDTEIKQLIYEYEDEKMNISQIADIHKMTPCNIARKLKILGIIPIDSAARGYSEYKNSDLYKEISGSSKNPRVESAIKMNFVNTLKEPAINNILKSSNDIDKEIATHLAKNTANFVNTTLFSKK